MTDAFTEYFTGVYDGTILACHKMRLVSERLLKERANPGRWHFNDKRANKPIAFIERYCRQAEGELGKPIRLEPFQKARIQAIYGFIDDVGLRRFWEAMIIEGRKNGKSCECAALELYGLIGDGEGAPQIYSVATKLDQAKLSFNYANNMRIQSPAISKAVKKRSGDMYAKRNFGTIAPLSKETKSQDGLNIHMAVIDELAAIENRDIYDLARQGMQSRRQPLLFSISTNGFVRDNIFDAQYSYAKDWLEGKIKDDRFLAFIYELDQREEWQDESKWAKANPGLGTIKSYEFLKASVSKAKQDPTYLPTVLTKDFNLVENSSTAFLTWADIENKATFEMEGFTYAIAGFDLSETTDLTAAVILMMRPDDPNIYMKSMYWTTEAVMKQNTTTGTRAERDGVPYSQWEKQGLIRVCPGNRIEKAVVLDWLEEFQEETGVNIYYVGYDPWHVEDAMKDRLDSRYGKRNNFEVRQGYKTQSPSLKELRAELQANHVIHQMNPIDVWCMANAAVKVDENNNIMLTKKDNRGKNRIDGFAALLNAYVILKEHYDDYIALI